MQARANSLLAEKEEATPVGARGRRSTKERARQAQRGGEKRREQVEEESITVPSIPWPGRLLFRVHEPRRPGRIRIRRSLLQFSLLHPSATVQSAPEIT